MAFFQIQSFLRVDDFSRTDVLKLFSRAETIKNQLRKGQNLDSLKAKQVVLVFNESSTRTKISFQLAAQRLGAQCTVIDNVQTSSMKKGETFLDTFWTLHSMAPDLFVIRCGDSESLREIEEKTRIPVINGGFGSKAHPTQALLDLFTMKEHFGLLEGLKVLFVGDVRYSRVVRSDIKLLKKFGARPAICSSKNFLDPSFLKKGAIEVFDNLEKAVSWCDVYMGLRIQLERHQGVLQKTREELRSSYSLNQKVLQKLSEKAIIMHPGPVNWGVEFDSLVRSDPRLFIWKQKENGVYVRASLMEFLLKTLGT